MVWSTTDLAIWKSLQESFIFLFVLGFRTWLLLFLLPMRLDSRGFMLGLLVFLLSFFLFVGQNFLDALDSFCNSFGSLFFGWIFLWRFPPELIIKFSDWRKKLPFAFPGFPLRDVHAGVLRTVHTLQSLVKKVSPILSQRPVYYYKPPLENPVGPLQDQPLVHLLEETVGRVGPLVNQLPVRHRPEQDFNVFEWCVSWIGSQWSQR